MTDSIRCPRNASSSEFQRLLSVETDECVPWPYARDSSGYGVRRVEGKAQRTHVLACIQAHGPQPSPQQYIVAHSCRNPPCMNPRHLRWATQLENMRDAIAHDTWSRGERHGIAVLTDEQVIDIRESYALGASMGGLARHYGVHRITVRSIIRGEHWKHLLVA